MSAWRLHLAASVRRSLDGLPEKAAAAVVEFTLGPLLEEPRRVGKPLSRELTGYLAARRGPYRVVYRLDEKTGTVKVVRLDHRAAVYRPR